MARARSFRGRGISDSQRRKKSWIQITGPAIVDSGSSGGVQTPNMTFAIASGGLANASSQGRSIGLISDPVLDKVPAESTILRLRGSINLQKNSLDTPNGVVENLALGIGVMEATAAALGAFPNPATPDGGAWDGWMFYRSQQQSNVDANSGVVDVKSMRKVQSGEAIIIVFGVFVATDDGSDLPQAVNDRICSVNLRGLILLP